MKSTAAWAADSVVSGAWPGVQRHGDAGRRAAPVAQCVVQQVVQDAFHQRDIAPHHHGLVQALGAQVHP